jgi:hypothetical protein
MGFLNGLLGGKGINRGEGCGDDECGGSGLLFFFLILVILFSNCELFDDGCSLLFFFLLLVIIFCNCEGGLF